MGKRSLSELESNIRSEMKINEPSFLKKSGLALFIENYYAIAGPGPMRW